MTNEKQPKRGLNIALWILQILLALLFANAGFMKTFKPVAEIAPMIPWAADIPEALLRFIGISELLGAVGLILPAALKIRPQLTTLAAAGLTLIMIFAVLFHVTRGEFSALIGNGVIGFVAGFIAYGRWKLAPISSKK